MIKTHSIALKLSLVLSAVCATIFLSVFLLYFGYARDLLLRNVENQARELLGANVNELNSFFLPIKASPDNLVYFLEHCNLERREIEGLLASLVDKNQNIYGAEVAFEPGAMDKKERYYGFFAERWKGGKSRIGSLGGGKYNYFTFDWYQIPFETRSPQWTEPYIDNLSGRVMMVTYSRPFYGAGKEENIVKGVVGADVSIESISAKIASIKVLKTGYAFLISQNGTYIAHPIRELVMNETIFSLAETKGFPELRTIGRDMIAGKTGSARVFNLMTGRPAKLFYAPVSSTGWSLAVVFPEEEYLADIQKLNNLLGVLALAGFMLMLGAVTLLARSITRPLAAMSDAAGRIAGGNLDTAIPPVESRDEVGLLADAFSHMQRSLKDYIVRLTSETAVRQRMESELSIAREIQFSFLPRRLPAGPAFELAAALEPAKEVGGDLYDCFMVDEKRLCLVIGDVTGKGVPAALFMSVAKALLKNAANRGFTPDRMLAEVNGQLCDGNDSAMFVTVFAALLDTGTGELSYASAGHNPPVLISGGKSSFIPKLPGPPLGIRENAAFKLSSIRLAPGDVLLAYTDGVTEAMDRDGVLYSDERLLAYASSASGQNVRELVAGLMKEIDSYSKGVRSDDTTLLAVKFLG